MKTVIALVFLLAVPLTAYAQTHSLLDDQPHAKTENFTATSVDLSGKYYFHSTVPNRLLDDYHGYDHVPGEQMDVLVRSNLIWGVTLDVDVYAWIGENQWISRIGLMGELRYQTPLEWINIGWGHHSWHNIDVDVARYVGHQQDWALVRIDAPTFTLGEHAWIRASIEPHYFMGNKEPLLIKDMYGPVEDHARTMLALPLVGVIDSFAFEVKPYVQFGKHDRRYGVAAEFIYNFTSYFAVSLSGEYFESTNGRYQDMEAVGIKLRLKN